LNLEALSAEVPAVKRLDLLLLIVLAVTALVLVLRLSTATAAKGKDEEGAARERLVRSMRNYADTIGEKADPRVLEAVRSVPRHLFVPEAERREAYEDYPLPIGEEQTISQPSLVALMTHLLRPEPDDVMLEVGTGSGYQAAVLSLLVRRVYSIEIVGPLARQAAERLDRLGYDNVEVRHGDGYLGWKPGGRIVIPVGSTLSNQQLRLITKGDDGKVRQQRIIDVRFVPLTRTVR
jgi:protein-L-isoaspartate(D-aspartate) O-methyltransferase